MPQSPLAATIATGPSKAQAQAGVDNGGLLLTTMGGKSSLLNVTAAAVVKASAGRAGKIVVIAPGTTGGVLTLNDSATTGGASAANTIYTAGFAALSVGLVINLDFPVANGLVVSAVPSAGSPQFAISFS